MKLLAENTKQGYCPLCGAKLGEYTNKEYEDGYFYYYYDCGKCDATQIEEVWQVNEQYSCSNAWKPMD